MKIFSPFSLCWQEVASTLVSTTPGDRRKGQQRHAGRRSISQESVRQMRADFIAEMTAVDIARKHGVSVGYVRKILHEGLRDDEREVFR